MTTFPITISFQKEKEDFDAPQDWTVGHLKQHLEGRFGVPQANQKVVCGGGALQPDEALLGSTKVGKGGGRKRVMLLGQTDASMTAFKEQEAKAEALKEQKARHPVMRASASDEEARALKHRQAEEKKEQLFGRVELLDMPERDFAQRMMDRILNDKGIKEIMRRHKWKVGLLTELTPFNREINGYNQNHGQVIAVKFRDTEDPTAWRSWPDIEATMLHELCHCDWSDHDANFWKCFRNLNKEIKSLDWTKGSGNMVGGEGVGRTADGGSRTVDLLAASDELDWRTATQRSSGQALGGSRPVEGMTPAGMAGMMVLAQHEKAAEASCGNGKA